MDVRHDNNALQELNDCIRGLLHLGLNVITFRTLLHLGPNVITFRTLLQLGHLLHLGLQHTRGEMARDRNVLHFGPEVRISQLQTVNIRTQIALELYVETEDVCV